MVIIANIPDVREVNSDDAEALGRLRSGLNPNVQRTAVFAVDIPCTAIFINFSRRFEYLNTVI